MPTLASIATPSSQPDADPAGDRDTCGRETWSASDWFDEVCRLDEMQAPIGSVVAAAEQGLRIARDADDPSGILEGALMLAVAYSDRGRYAESVRVMAREMNSVQRCTDRSTVSGFLAVMASNLADAGEYVRALRYHEEAIRVHDPEDPVSVYRVHINYLITLIGLDRAGDAGALAAAVRDVRSRLPANALRDYRVTHTCAILAIVAADVASRPDGGSENSAHRDLRDALEAIKEGIAIARTSMPSMMDIVTVARSLCRTLLGEEDPEGADFLARKQPGSLSDASTLMIHAVVRWALLVLRIRRDTVLARRILDLVSPGAAPSASSAPMLRWLIASATVHEEDGDFQAACAGYRAQIAAAERHQAMILSVRSEIADVVAEAELARNQIRSAMAQAADLQQRNVELTADRQRLAAAAQTDPLTGLSNRRALDERIAALGILPNRPLYSVAILDIDHFKAVNDRFSHLIGDQVITAVGALLSRSVRAGDLVARYGGEEFVILVKGRLTPTRADQWRRALQFHPWTAIADGLGVTVSLGVALWQPGETFDSAFAQADERLYRAKNAGRNRVVAD